MNGRKSNNCNGWNERSLRLDDDDMVAIELHFLDCPKFRADRHARKVRCSL